MQKISHSGESNSFLDEKKNTVEIEWTLESFMKAIDNNSISQGQSIPLRGKVVCQYPGKAEKIIEILKNTPVDFIKQSLKEKYPISQKSLLLWESMLFDKDCVLKVLPDDLIKKISFLNYAVETNQVRNFSLFKNLSPKFKVSEKKSDSSIFLNALKQELPKIFSECENKNIELTLTDEKNEKVLKISSNQWTGDMTDTIYKKLSDYGLSVFVAMGSFPGYNINLFGEVKIGKNHGIRILSHEAIEFFAVYLCKLDPSIVAFTEPKNEECCVI